MLVTTEQASQTPAEATDTKSVARPQNNRPWPQKSLDRIQRMSEERAKVQASFRRISQSIVELLPSDMQLAVETLYTLDHTARTERRHLTRWKNNLSAVPRDSAADFSRRQRERETLERIKSLDTQIDTEWKSAVARFESIAVAAVELAVATLDKKDKNWIAPDEIWLLSYYAREPMTIFHAPFQTQKLAFRAIRDNPDSFLSKCLAEDANIKERKQIEAVVPARDPNAPRDTKICAFCPRPTSVGVAVSGVGFCSTTCANNFRQQLLRDGMNMAKAYLSR